MLKKKLLALLMVICFIPVMSLETKGDVLDDSIIVYVSSPMASVDQELTFLEPDNFQIVTIENNKVVLVPLTFLGMALDADDYIEETRAASGNITIDKRTIAFKSNSDQATLTENDETRRGTMKAPAQVINDKLYVPLEYTAAFFGKEYFYDKGLAIVSDTPNVYSLTRNKVDIEKWISKLNALPVIGSEKNFVSLTGKPDQYAAPVTAAAKEPVFHLRTAEDSDKLYTDGSYIYYADSRTITVMQASPGHDTRRLFTTTIPDENVTIDRIFVQDTTMAVIGQSSPGEANGLTRTHIYVYDISSKTTLKQIKKVELDGSYVYASVNYPHIYVAVNIDLGYLAADGTFSTPGYKDMDQENSLKYDETYYFPEISSPAYTVIAGIDMGDPSKAAVVNTYFGNDGLLYISGGNLYMPVAVDSGNSFIYKFTLSQGKANYSRRFSVSGHIPSIYAIDESDELLRVVTTGKSNSGTDTNYFYLFDKEGQVKKSIDKIAEGKQIFAISYMGERAYMVTTSLDDPLYVLNMGNPKNPSYMGQLKLSGAADYLHYFDGIHLLGFKAAGDGLNLALYDVSDIENPTVKYQTKIEDRGITASVLSNYRTLLVSKNKSALVIPAAIHSDSEGNESVSQGAYIYNISLTGGFSLKGFVQHSAEEGEAVAIDRVLYMNDYYYTLSPKLVIVYGLSELKELARVELAGV